MSYCFLNDEIMPEQSAMVSIGDRGFLYGEGLFETLRSYSGYLFNIDNHLSRLKDSSKALGIPFDYPSDKIKSAIKELIVKNNLPDAYVRITLSMGAGSLGSGISDSEAQAVRYPTLVIQVKPLRMYAEWFYIHGMSAIVSQYRRSISCPISSHKTTNFMVNMLARKEASEKGAHEIILLNTEGYVAEGSISNLFIVVDGITITPPLSANILPGITRQTVLDMCKANGIPVKEECFGVDKLLNAEECFLTNSLMEIMPVSSVNGGAIGGSIPGRLTRYLMGEYKRLIYQEMKKVDN